MAEPDRGHFLALVGLGMGCLAAIAGLVAPLAPSHQEVLWVFAAIFVVGAIWAFGAAVFISRRAARNSGKPGRLSDRPHGRVFPGSKNPLANNPRAIRNQLRVLPSLEVEKLISELTGKEVRWEGLMRHLASCGDGKVEIKVDFDEGKNDFFQAIAPLHPWMALLKPNDHVMVAGVIAFLRADMILDDARLVAREAP